MRTPQKQIKLLLYTASSPPRYLSGKKMKITFVTTSFNYPIHRKRFESLQQLCANIEAYGCIQDFSYPTSRPETSSLPTNCKTIQPGHYVRRILQLSTLIFQIRKAIQTTDVIYAVGFDGALLARIATLLSRHSPIFVYEIHDIRQAMMREDIVGRGFRFIERWIMRGVSVLVPTSDSYVSGYYHKKLGATNFSTLTLENKRWPQDVTHGYLTAPKIAPLRIGYFGSLRCNLAWNALIRLVESANGLIELEVRGDPQGLDTFYQDIENIPGIHYGGPYRDPDDLYDVYSKVSIVWAAGFHGKDSHIWQRSCRFYNSCSHQRPIISMVGTDEGDVINKLGIGCCIDLHDLPGTITRIKQITQAELSTWYDNLKKLPPSVYTYSDEHTKLLNMCATLAKASDCHE